jgi:hypothetical protein
LALTKWVEASRICLTAAVIRPVAGAPEAAFAVGPVATPGPPVEVGSGVAAESAAGVGLELRAGLPVAVELAAQVGLVVSVGLDVQVEPAVFVKRAVPAVVAVFAERAVAAVGVAAQQVPAAGMCWWVVARRVPEVPPSAYGARWLHPVDGFLVAENP